MKLYELTALEQQVADMCEEAEDPQAIIDTLESMNWFNDYIAKANCYGKLIALQGYEAKALKAEEDRLHNRRKSVENNIERMKQALKESMQVTGMTKFKSDLFSFGIQKNPPAAKLNEGITWHEVPERYLEQQEPKILTGKILEDLKNGENLDFAHIEQGESLRIR